MATALKAAMHPIHSALRLLVVAVFVIVHHPAFAQENGQNLVVTGDRLSGFVLPIEPIASPVSIKALRTWAWTVDDTKRLFLQGDVHISLGGYSFDSRDAVVWINRIPSAQGVINQVAIYFQHVEDPTKQAGLGARGEQLLVTGSTRGDVSLEVALMLEGQPTGVGMITQAEARLAKHLRTLLGDEPTLESRPQVNAIEERPRFVPVPGGEVPDAADDLPRSVTLPPTQAAGSWLMNPQGRVLFTAKQVEIARGEEENVITAIGDIVVDVQSGQSIDATDRLTLTADRAVIYTDPGPLVSGDNEISGEKVRGVYLEGAVTVSTHNGQYFVRAPQIYYDFRAQKAIMVDSLLRVQPRDFTIPVYARADEMRQLASNQWQANRLRVSTSEFATPHLAIGSKRAVITQREEENGSRTMTHIDARSNTLRIADVPIFLWPRFKGDVERTPLKAIEVGSRDNDGVRVMTTWDFFTLAGLTPPDGVEADLKLDAFTKRGGGAGFDFKYDVADSEGRVDLYGLYDTGIDRTSSGLDVDPDDEFRGVALFENQTQLTRNWLLQAQGSLISDESFITTWREADFYTRREYETSVYLKHQDDTAAFTALAKTSLQDFVSNSYLLASRQYSVDKVPEITYRRYGDSIFNDRFTYSSESRLTRMSMVFTDRTPQQLGVPGGAFGIAPTTNIAGVLAARGLNENWVSRFDTRHELSMPLHPGIFNVTPFVVGRFTGYDDDFTSFSSDADSMRFFGAGGVRLSTEFQRVANATESRLLNLHRLRHIMEPYATLWTSYASVTQQNLPVFDEEVESLADGSAIALGVRNTWQTQRGGPGRWRSVDWLTLDTSVVFDSEDAPNESPNPQFFDYRPEYSMFGDHARAKGVILLSDNFSIAGDATYLLDNSMLGRSSIGAELRHSPVLLTFVEYRYIQANMLELIDFGWQYQITPKYRITFTPQWDLRAEEFRAVSVVVTRRFPDFDLVFIVRYDEIRNDTQFGASLDLARF